MQKLMCVDRFNRRFVDFPVIWRSISSIRVKITFARVPTTAGCTPAVICRHLNLVSISFVLHTGLNIRICARMLYNNYLLILIF